MEMRTIDDIIDAAETDLWNDWGTCGYTVGATEKIAIEYAEEYAKAFIEYSRAERFGLWELPDLFESFKESLKK